MDIPTWPIPVPPPSAPRFCDMPPWVLGRDSDTALIVEGFQNLQKRAMTVPTSHLSSDYSTSSLRCGSLVSSKESPRGPPALWSSRRSAPESKRILPTTCRSCSSPANGSSHFRCASVSSQSHAKGVTKTSVPQLAPCRIRGSLPIAPLCSEKRRYLSSEIFRGRLPHNLGPKPGRSLCWR